MFITPDVTFHEKEIYFGSFESSLQGKFRGDEVQTFNYGNEQQPIDQQLTRQQPADHDRPTKLQETCPAGRQTEDAMIGEPTIGKPTVMLLEIE